MTKNERYSAVQLYFIPSEYPNVTTVTMKDGVKHYGFFDVGGFDNDEQLKADCQFWFVPNHNMGAYLAEQRLDRKKDATLCILIDVDDIEAIVYQTPNKEVLKEVSFV